MPISDARYAGEIVTTRGRVLKFDAVECMARYTAGMSASDQHSVWATDVREPGALVNVDQLTFVRNDSLRTPMGGGVVGFRKRAPATGPLMRWADVVGHFEATATATPRDVPATTATR
jgi:copper chaperone NosL